jgi:hypothetical protein
MPTIKETEVFKFSELSDEAKQKALQWAFDGVDFQYHAENVIDDAKQIAALFGLEIDKVYYSGFSSQGDGACFEGAYRYKKGALKAVKAYAPQDTDLHGIVQRLQESQRKQFYQLEASCKQTGHYMHSECMSVDVEHAESRYKDIEDAEDDIRDELRYFADWIYKRLETEYDYQTSEEVLTEWLIESDYTFDEEGNYF